MYTLNIIIWLFIIDLTLSVPVPSPRESKADTQTATVNVIFISHAEHKSGFPSFVFGGTSDGVLNAHYDNDGKNIHNIYAFDDVYEEYCPNKRLYGLYHEIYHYIYSRYLNTAGLGHFFQEGWANYMASKTLNCTKPSLCQRYVNLKNGIDSRYSLLTFKQFSWILNNESIESYYFGDMFIEYIMSDKYWNPANKHLFLSFFYKNEEKRIAGERVSASEAQMACDHLFKPCVSHGIPVCECTECCCKDIDKLLNQESYYDSEEIPTDLVDTLFIDENSPKSVDENDTIYAEVISSCSSASVIEFQTSNTQMVKIEELERQERTIIVNCKSANNFTKTFLSHFICKSSHIMDCGTIVNSVFDQLPL